MSETVHFAWDIADCLVKHKHAVQHLYGVHLLQLQVVLQVGTLQLGHNACTIKQYQLMHTSIDAAANCE